MPAPAASSPRLVYLDLIKVLAITMVCTYHLSLVGDLLTWSYPPSGTLVAQRLFWGMMSPCVPLFFAATGALTLGDDRPVQFKRHVEKVVRLFVQFLLWQTITMLVMAAWQGVDLTASGGSVLVSALLFSTRGVPLSLHHLWFIPTFIAVSFALPLFKPLFARGDEAHPARRYCLILFVLLVLFFFVFPDIQRFVHYLGHKGFIMSKMQTFLPFSDLIAVMTAYALLGAYLCRMQPEMRRKVPPIVLAGVFFLGAFLLLGRWNIECTLSGESWDNVYKGYGTTGTLLMTAALYCLFARIDNQAVQVRHPGLVRVARVASQNTLSVYYLHWIILYTVWQLALPYLMPLDPAARWILSIVKGILLVAVCVPISVLLRRVPVVGFLFKQ